jgi:hypothetical protein
MRISLTPRFIFRTVIVWTLMAFFLVGAVEHIVQPFAAPADDARWHYAPGFHYLTGMMEFAAALLVAREKTRPLAAAIGGLAMASAILTFLLRAEPVQAAAPVVVLIALFACLKLDAKAREVRWECKVF